MLRGSLLAAAIVCVAACAGCGGEPGGEGTAGDTEGVTVVVTQTVQAPPSTTAADEPGQDAGVDVVEHGFTTDKRDLSYGAVLHNTSDVSDALGVEVSVNALDKSGNVLATEDDTISVIPAGQDFVIGRETRLEKGAKVDSIEIIVDVDDSVSAQYPVPKVRNARYQADEYGGWTVRAQVTNNMDSTLSSITDVYAIIRDTNGKIVGGANSYPDSDLKPGRRAALEISSFMDLPGAQDAEVSVDNEVTEDD